MWYLLLCEICIVINYNMFLSKWSTHLPSSRSIVIVLTMNLQTYFTFFSQDEKAKLMSTWRAFLCTCFQGEWTNKSPRELWAVWWRGGARWWWWGGGEDDDIDDDDDDEEDEEEDDDDEEDEEDEEGKGIRGGDWTRCLRVCSGGMWSSDN